MNYTRTCWGLAALLVRGSLAAAQPSVPAAPLAPLAYQELAPGASRPTGWLRTQQWLSRSNGFTTSPDSRENWLLYHAKAAADGKCEGRSARAQRFGWNADGSPDFGVPAALGAPQPVPSGE